MSVIGIVCEFNPFHNGHKHLIDSVKRDGDIVVCVMSGNYVQRGEPAIFPKDIRVNSALVNGADIVLELPFVYATASAEIFAKNAVKILTSFGCDKIAFGTENASVHQLEKTVEIMLSDDFDAKVKKNLETGVNYPTARQMAFNDYLVDCDILLPNNILAIEYLSAIKKNNYNITPVVVNREGADYNDEFAIDKFASATYIRTLIKDKKDFSKFVPKSANDIYVQSLNEGNWLDSEKFNTVALAVLRSSNNDFSSVANMAEGLENRLVYSIKDSLTLYELYDKVKTKRYTHSRIRRAVLAATIGVLESDIKIDVPYCRLLGFNISVGDVLGRLVNKSSLPFVVNYSDILGLDSVTACRVFELENKSTDLFNLSLNKTAKCSTEKTYSVIKVR